MKSSTVLHSSSLLPFVNAVITVKITNENLHIVYTVLSSLQQEDNWGGIIIGNNNHVSINIFIAD